MTGVQEKTTTRQRPTRGGQNTNGRGSSSAGSSRGARKPPNQMLAELEPMISALIKENRELHRQIDKLSRETVGVASAAVERTLRSIERRISGSLDGETTTGRRRSARAISTTKARRKVADPQLLERRRQALAKAREVRAAKRASQQVSS